MVATDEELVARSMEGDAESFNQLVLRWERPIYALAYRVIGRDEDARDVAQETFLRAFRALPGFKGQAKFSSWLYRIALNLCRDWIRRKKRTPIVEMPEGVDIVELAAEQGPVESIEDLVARKEMSRIVAEGMKLLPEEQRTAIVLKEYHGLTFQEIADLQGCPLSTVKTRLYQGLTVLRRHLESEGMTSFHELEGIMSTLFTCDDKPTLIAYLYGEVDTATRAGVDAHLASCERCAAEVSALGDVRTELALWAPPDAKLGFAITRTSEPQRGHGVAAGALVEHRARVGASGRGRPRARRGRRRREPAGAIRSRRFLGEHRLDAASSRPWQRRFEQNTQDFQTALVALEQQLRSEIRSTHEQNAVRAAAPPADEATMRRVQQLIAASEERQQRELALRLTQFTVDVNMQRRADLVRIRDGFGQFDEQMLRQRQMLNNVIRVSATGQQ